MHGAVILAAGSSARMGGGLKKEFIVYNGKPLLYYSVKSFIDSGLFSNILVTCRKDLLDETRNQLGDLGSFKGSDSGRVCPIDFTAGGDTRQESVLNSLEFLAAAYPRNGVNLESILIHDGARPFVSFETIERVLTCTGEKGACIPVEPCTNTMKLVDDSGRITAHLERNLTRGAQTPQGFQFPPLLQAHRQMKREGLIFTDDSEIWERFVGSVYTVEGNRENIKITYPEDLNTLAQLRGESVL